MKWISPCHNWFNHFAATTTVVVSFGCDKTLFCYVLGCTAYDVVINPTFYSKIQKSELFHSFFLTIVFEGLESKYDMELERKWTVLKNKKCMGSLHPHCIRSKSKPVIMEMEDDSKSASGEGKPLRETLAVKYSLHPFVAFYSHHITHRGISRCRRSVVVVG